MRRGLKEAIGKMVVDYIKLRYNVMYIRNKQLTTDSFVPATVESLLHLLPPGC